MTWLNRAIAAVKEALAPLPLGWRITTVAILSGVVIGLFWLLQGGTPTADDYLLGGRPFSATEIALIQAAFARAGLTGAVVEGDRIRVPTGHEPQYILAMAEDNALPSDFPDHFAKALKDAGPFMDPKVREEMIKNEKQRHLAMIIGAMPNVENAAVTYEIRKPSGLSRELIASAAVSVKPALSHTLDSSQVRKVRHLVAAGLGLKPEQVTVADLSPGGAVYVGSDSGPLGEGEDHKYLTVMRAHQKLIEETIQKALSYIPNVSVSASVELNPEVQIERNNTTFDSKQAGTLNTRDESTTRTTEQAGPGGRPGLAAQQPGGANQPAVLAGGGSTSTSEDSTSTSEVKQVPAHRTETSTVIGLTPKNVKVSVGVPMSYYAAIFQQRNPAPAGQAPKQPTENDLRQIEEAEVAKIQKHVAQLIPTTVDPADASATPLVQVSSFYPPPASGLPDVALTDRVLSWLSGSWSTLGMFALALVALWMLRSLWKSVPPPEPVEEGPPMPTLFAAAMAPSAPQPAEEAPSEPEKPKLARRISGGGASLREELAQIVREDPNTAANVIKSWIGTTS
jgi:flagellar M-ring protein FliF